MKGFVLSALCLLVLMLSVPARSMTFEPPSVPDSGMQIMPDSTESFGEALMELLERALAGLRPDLRAALKTGVAVILSVLAVRLLQTFSGSVQWASEMAGSAVIAMLMLTDTRSMIGLATETIQELSDYGKLLCPVLTAALAAQGGLTASAALYAGTALFDAVLGSLIAKLLVPGVYLFLAFGIAHSALGEELLKRIRDMIRSLISWLLRTMLIIFTTYMSITGVVSGTTDAAALKATRVTISTVVPVVGGILADASEAVLVSAGLAKSAAGIYGILAVLAVFLSPFITIGTQYLVLKATAAVSTLFGAKQMTGLIEDFSAAMGLLLAMTGSVCLLLLISTVCFLKGAA